MYRYDSFDRDFVRNRVAQFRQQVERRIDGSLTEEEFKPLRLMNGLYLQLHAYMLRVAIPYGTLDSRQMRRLAHIAERWDKGYGHFTTRQNVQFNWPRLKDVPDILDALADVEMHAIQTSGNCVRNVTADHFAGAAADEIADPRPTAELLRQWSTDHPEFAFLPRKFKIAVSGSPVDRAVTRAHDIGIRIVRIADGELGYEVAVGGGLGRTPVIGSVIRKCLPEADLLPYVESVLQVYNAIGRRDNKFKARIKFTVGEHGIEAFRDRVEERFRLQRKAFGGADRALLERIRAMFAAPAYVQAPTGGFDAALARDPVFRSFVDTNLHPHRNPDYAIVTVSLKAHGATPGDATADQMRVIADLAERYGHDEIRISHEQNCVLPHVHRRDVPAVHAALREAGLATANVGLASDIIACPGLDYCNLATARSIPIAQGIARRMKERGDEREVGDLKIRISGCVNACGHHHVGHIGILGLDRAGVENYQITLGGDGTDTAALGERTGPAFPAEDVVPAVDRLIDTYLELRSDDDEAFLATYRRVGMQPFKAALYPDSASTAGS
ncbi:MAG: nitrite/sulfite reductase [Defluviicoccus sp.]|nr:nitrite/sulfite reductase [Defluviicoccus sp.]